MFAMLIDRRTMLNLSAIGAGTIGVKKAVQAKPLRSGPLPTPPQAIGPFYPVVRAGENMANLTRVEGQADRAPGDLIELRGAVRTTAGASVPSAIVVIWQADASGAYNHPRNDFGTPDPRFLGHAVVRTDRAGEFSLLTVRPGAYPDMPGSMRTPHIHFEIIGEESRLITQMYFPGEPLNASDRLLRELRSRGGDPRSLIATATTERSIAGAARLSWTMLLARG
jgi:protocatechuate 3,4-dioxygenase beta subunit